MAGTPIIATGMELLAGCTLLEARGILNGTTNYILTQMENGLDYDAALQQAQVLGYAETDPSADVGAVHRIAAGWVRRAMVNAFSRATSASGPAMTTS